LIDNVVIINEESCCVNQSKAECYATSQAEKATRSALKAELDRSLAPRTLVILDSMNYIKGYRYELHCLSKAVGERHGVVWILNSVDVIRQWNDERYSEELLNALIQRYEPPDARNRWDKPLYRVDLTPTTASDTPSSSTTNQAAQDALQRSVYNMHSLSLAITDSAAAAPKKPRAKSAASSFKKRTQNKGPNTANVDPSKETSKADNNSSAKEPAPDALEKKEPTSNDANSKKLTLEDRIDEILDSFFLDVEPLKEGTSTHQNMLGDADVLNKVDSLTQKLCNIIAQAPSGRVELLEYGVSLQSARKLALPELKRLRQQYIRWVAQHPPTDASEQGLVHSFVKYVEGHV
jgi:protein KTI12